MSVLDPGEKDATERTIRSVPVAAPNMTPIAHPSPVNTPVLGQETGCSSEDAC